MSRLPPANRDDELALFDRMVAGQTRRRILLLEAAGGIGKSTLLAEFVRHCPDDVPCVPVDLKGSPGLHQVLARLGDALGWDRFPAFAAAVERLGREAAAPGAETGQFEHLHLEEYDLAAIHDLMVAAFTASALRRFCRYRLPFDRVLRHFGEDPSLEDAVEIVIVHCQQHDLLSDLLVGIREERFGQYKRYYARLYGREAAVHRPARPGAGVGRAEIEVALRSPDEGDRATRRGVLTRALFDDLAAWSERAAWPGRLVLLFDTYDKAGPEVQAWFAGPFLTGARRLASLAVVVAGRQVPEQSIEWAVCCIPRRLQKLPEPELWQGYAERIGAVVPSPEWIAAFCDVFEGHPLKMMEALDRYIPTGGRR
jgi:hypothetical protein